jgi:hypothetical protein
MSMRLIRRSSVALLGAILVLSTFAIAPVLAVGPTTHFSITGLNASNVAGVADTFTVTALDATNATDTTFVGTVSFSSTDGGAVLPANGSSLVAGTGTADFSVTFHFTGSPQTLTVTQVGAPTVTGSANSTVTPAAATHLTVSGFTNPVVAGVSGGVDVSAIDAFNNVDTNFNGTIHMTSSDAAATLPLDTAMVNGQLSYPSVITLKTAGTQSITLTATVTPFITGSQAGIVVNPAAATHLTVTGYPSPTVAGVSHNATVTALDAFNNTATGYTGIVHLTSTDGAAVLAGNHTYVGGDNGVHAFAVTLNTVGARTITATDTVTASITGTSAGITVTAANVAPVAVADSASVTVNSGATAINVLANDTDGNLDILHVASATQPSHGTVVVPGGGANVTYMPTAGFVGTDTFTYKANDGTVDSNSATVTVHVGNDTTKPVATAPVQTIGSQIVGVDTVKVHLTWSGTDVGLGIKNFEFWQATDGGAFVKIKTTTAQSANVQMTRNHTYQLRVRAIDKAGNIGSYAVGPVLKFVRYQETSASHLGTWTTSNSTSYSGGHALTTSVTGSSASLRTTGRTYTWIGAHGPTRSTADVYVDGVLRAHVNLFSTVRSYGRVIYSITFATKASHQINIVYTGLSSGRIDLDQIIVLR